jgi:hypothetical protein
VAVAELEHQAVRQQMVSLVVQEEVVHNLQILLLVQETHPQLLHLKEILEVLVVLPQQVQVVVLVELVELQILLLVEQVVMEQPHLSLAHL